MWILYYEAECIIINATHMFFSVTFLYIKYIIIIISFPTCKFNDQSLIVLNMHITVKALYTEPLYNEH